MEHRYSLRFETGERAGELVPIQGQGFTIGRRPGHALQILDNSVSGQHAEIVLDAQGALLKDLGSTNGTKVRGARIVETRLADGDRIHFGGVEMVFVDSKASSPAVASVPPGAAPLAGTAPLTPGAGDAVVRVSPEVLARSRKRPIAGLVGLLVLVLAAAGLWFYLRKSGGAVERPAKPVAASRDNLLGDAASFEGEADGWNPGEGAPAAFVKSADARVSGGSGVVADLSGDDEGGWALHRSPEARADAGRTLTASTEIRVESGAIGQVGIELSPAEGPDSAGAVVAWSKPAVASGSFAAASVSAVVPPGFESARVLLLARIPAESGSKSGSVAVDDASLSVSEGSNAAPVSVGDWQLDHVGETSAVLSRSGRPLVTGLAFAAGSDPVRLALASPSTATAETGRIRLASAGAAEAKGLTLRAEAALVRGGLSTAGAEGFAAHGPDFERASATSLLLGNGAETVRLLFASPVSLRGVAEGSAARIQAVPEGSGLGEVVVQLEFAEDKKTAGDLAYAARNAERKGDLGECLAKWSELLNGYPLDEALVAEGDAKRASLVQQGLKELQDVRVEVERARFFKLVDLDRRCKERALAVGAKYKGSEVDAEAQRIAVEIDGDLAVLEVELAKAERGRLEGILAALEARKATGLAAEVRAHLEKMPKRLQKPGQAAQIPDAAPEAPSGSPHGAPPGTKEEGR